MGYCPSKKEPSISFPLNLGNQLRHAYFGIDHKQSWRIVTTDVSSLNTTYETLLFTLQAQDRHPPDIKGLSRPS